MTTVGLRELRQDASDVIRRVEAGEEIDVTVSGRPAARLVPVTATARQWRQWNDVADLFGGPADPTWASDHDLIDDGVVDPWTERR